MSWFCSLKGNEFFAEVEHEFMQDDFNLTGLSAQVPYYEYALDTILDSESSAAARFSKEQQEAIESAAELLYGLIHARYIITPRGMAAMLDKVRTATPSVVRARAALAAGVDPVRGREDPLFHPACKPAAAPAHPSQYKGVHFGRCPRVHCQGQPALPVGQSDLPRMHTTKIFCPRCADIYYPRSSRQARAPRSRLRHPLRPPARRRRARRRSLGARTAAQPPRTPPPQANVDGAYFGTTFAHMFLQSHWELAPAAPSSSYVPRIFGFKIHKSAKDYMRPQQQSGASARGGSAGAHGGSTAAGGAGGESSRREVGGRG